MIDGLFRGEKAPVAANTIQSVIMSKMVLQKKSSKSYVYFVMYYISARTHRAIFVTSLKKTHVESLYESFRARVETLSP